MESGQQRSNLTKLSELDLPLEEPWQDTREARQPRFVVVSAGGFLGVGKKHLLVPVEEVSRDVSEERVTVTETKDKVMNSPEFDLDAGVPPADLQRAIEAYYGHR